MNDNNMKICSLVYKNGIDLQYKKVHYWLLALIIILGLFVRLWGLGNVSLHGDEETTSMAALSVIETGLPYMPSGMFYPRAILQSYIIAASVWLFGISEWSLRFPSVLAGSLGILVAFYLGKRFLTPKFNMFFILIIALNPWMIKISQTARMYVFFSTAIALFVVFIFKWEEDERWSSFLTAFFMYILALQFHQLAIFSLFMFFFPFLMSPSLKKIFHSTAAFIAGGFFFLVARTWIAKPYSIIIPSQIDLPSNEVVLSPLKIIINNNLSLTITSLLLLLYIINTVTLIRTNKNVNISFYLSIIFFSAAICASLLLEYHVAFIFYICGVVLFFRSKSPNKFLLIYTLLLSLLLFFQFYFIFNSNFYPNIIKTGKIFIGSFSIYPYFKFIDSFLISSIFFVLLFVYILKTFAAGSPIQGFIIFFIISVWLPLFCQGFFTWYYASRYLFQYAQFFILICLAGVLYLEKTLKEKITAHSSTYVFITICIIIISFVKPLELMGTLNPGYKDYPDHKGAATFMKKIHLKADDIILAEDILEQVYYKVKADYWLRGFNDAKHAVKNENGVLKNIYTDVPLMGTGKKFERLLKDNNMRNIYIIGSGETFEKLNYYLSDGLLDVFTKYKKYAEIIYTGHDDKTLIWRFSAHSGIEKEL